MESHMSSNTAGVLAASWAAAVSIVLIGFLHLCAETSSAAKNLLKVWPAMGPLSGKVLVSYIAGIATYLLLLLKAGKSEDEHERQQAHVRKAFVVVLIAHFFNLVKDSSGKTTTPYLRF